MRQIRTGLRVRWNGRIGTITEITDGQWIDVVFDDALDRAVVFSIDDEDLQFI